MFDEVGAVAFLHDFMFIFPFIFLFPVVVVWSLYRQPNTANQVVATPIEHYAH
jgi:hypothetical protein